MTGVKVPCLQPDGSDCPERHVGCQSKCKRYLIYKAYRMALSRKRLAAIQEAEFILSVRSVSRTLNERNRKHDY